MNQYWVMLLTAAGLEIVWAVGLKYTEGFTRLWPSVGTILAMAASMYLLARAAEGLPIGTAYAVWTGIGAAGTAIIGMVVLGEAANVPRLACLALIICGVGGLRLLSGGG
jgi:quaternary ammonium compound-resistance protein SugE